MNLKYRKVNDHILSIFLSREDMEYYHLDTAQLFTKDPTETQDTVMEILKELDEKEEFIENGQFTAQVIPREEGLIINLFKLDSENPFMGLPEEFFKELAVSKTSTDKDEEEEEKPAEKPKSELLQAMNEMLDEQRQEDRSKPYFIVGMTDNFDSIISVACFQPHLNADDQNLYTQGEHYFLVLSYQPGAEEAAILRDASILDEWLQVEGSTQAPDIQAEELIPGHGRHLLEYIQSQYQ